MYKIDIQKLNSVRKKYKRQCVKDNLYILFKLKITDGKENFFNKCMKSIDALGRYKINYIQSNRVKKINENIRKSRN